MPRLGLPNLGLGLGLRCLHFAHILENQPDVAEFEAALEAFEGNLRRDFEDLDQIEWFDENILLQFGRRDP